MNKSKAENQSPKGLILEKKASPERKEPSSDSKMQNKKAGSGRSWIEKLEFDPTNIETVKRDVHSNKFDIFNKAKPWHKIPSLAVITGRNGQGKSILLEYIKQYSQSILQKGILYIEANKRFADDSSNTNILDFEKLEYFIRQQKTINDVINYLNSGEKPKQFKEQSLNQEFCWLEALMNTIPKDTEPTSDAIIAFAETVRINYSSFDADGPISRFVKIFQYYRQNVIIINEKIKITKLSTLFTYYNGLTQEEKKNDKLNGDLNEQLKKPEFYRNLEKSYTLQHLGTPPWEKVNCILKTHNFEYKIKPWQNANGTLILNESAIILQKGNTVIDYHALSSGEKLIFNLLSWLYSIGDQYNKKPIKGTIMNPKVKLMLLDEFDSHLDPKLIKLFLNIIQTEFVEKAKIQVIMTTHRVDTVKLAPKDSIFTLKNTNDVIEIENVHPLHAMFRMTNNIASILGYHVKVYAESTTDSRFYTGVYSTLREYCDNARKPESWIDKIKDKEANTENESFQWNIKKLAEEKSSDIQNLVEEKSSDINFRPLSQRYQMEFLPTSIEDKNGNRDGGGGCRQINQIILQNDNALITNNQPKCLFSEPGLNKYYGIVDRDFGQTSKLRSVEKYQAVVLEKRHSLENFIFDPVIFCSTLSADNLNKITNHSFKKICIKIKQKLDKLQENNILIKNLQDDIDDYFHQMHQIINKQIQDENKSRKKNELKESNIFKTLSNKDESSISKKEYQELKKYITKKIKQLNPVEFNDLILLKKSDQWEDIKIIIDKKHFIILKYPEFIFNRRGHDLEDYCFNSLLKTKTKIANTIVEQIKFYGLKFIPEDLAKTFFTLNYLIRYNVKNVFKKFTDQSSKNQSSGSSQTTQDKKEYTTDSVISEGTNASDNMGSSDSSDTKAELRHTDQLISTEIGDFINQDNNQDLMGCEFLPPDDSILI